MTRRPRVAVVGAGMSGICVAIALRRTGIADVVVYEKAASLGGTWRDNTYPGLTCDVPSRFYQFSFAKNPDWSQFFAAGDEINEYFRRVARDHDLGGVIRFGHEVVSAEFVDEAWQLTLSTGDRDRADFLVCATGFLHHPRIPALPGLESFAGTVFHSARWDHDVPLAGKRVGVVGTGSTGVQIVTALAGNVAGLRMFQRSPQWILPSPNPRYPRPAARLRARHPVLDEWSYRANQYSFEFLFDGLIRPGWQRTLAARLCRAHLRTVRDPALRRALTPDYQPGCRRLIVSGGFYRAIQSEGVELVTSPIDHVAADGVTTADGARHELDVLVLATGFDAHAYMRPMAITGPGGQTLDQAWAAGPRAYRTVALPGFPNLFTMIGPHSPIGNFPLTAVAEWQAEHVLGWVRRRARGEFRTVEPTAAATGRFNDELRAAMPNTVWATGCRSWYLGPDGLPELWPWRPGRHRDLMLDEPDPADYHFDRAPQPS